MNEKKKNLIFIIFIVLCVGIIGGLYIYDNTNNFKKVTADNTPTETSFTNEEEPKTEEAKPTIYCIGDDQLANDALAKVTIEGYNVQTLAYSGKTTQEIKDEVANTTIEPNDKNIYILMTGFNDSLSTNEQINNFIANQREIITSLNSERYIVAGVNFRTKFTNAKNINDTLQATYQDHFYNYRSFLLTSPRDQLGFTLTQQDNNDITQNLIPTSLRKDNTTGNELFYEILSNQLIAKINALGYNS